MAIFNNKQFLGLAAAGVLGGWLLKRKAEKVAERLNPVNEHNYINTAVNTVGTKLTGNEHFTLGGWIYDITHAREGDYMP